MDAVRLIVGKAGHWTVRVESDRVLYLHSQYDPYAEARRIVASWGEPKGEGVVIFGLGLGYHVLEYLQQYPSCTRIDVLEPRAQLIEWARQVTPEIFTDPRVVVHCVGGDATVKRLTEVTAEQILLHPPTVESLPPMPLKALLQEIHVIRGSEQRYREQLQINLKQNASRIHTGNVLRGQWGKFAGRPGVLVAAGPSLSLATNILRTLVDRKAIVLCVNRVLAYLLSQGIRPTGCVITESSDRAKEYWESLRPGVACPPLYALPTVSPAALANYSSDIVFVLQKGLAGTEQLARTLGADLLETGGSVSTLALSLLHYFGCDPILFVGLDLAYVDGRTHVGLGAARTTEASYTLHVPAVDGGTVRSTISWQSFRRWIEGFIASHPDRTYINASRGAHIEGTRALSHLQFEKQLEDWLNTRCGGEAAAGIPT
ncbi:hypothetical protein GCM10010885_20790 [Alicyclobacillus cellulosilyticus]|uniref:6-hydroxymethylpterin diphosphokinase MptE-like domain-containing protein n=1 Tax=Alicyclobacillus cellulosilyticus TaxID=1003997 RepID=A0A917KGZ7_9BACL|nr:hypothetical protein GCM10010885_20790 [Alicyclobacillus cellulosilyticus]